MRDVRCCLCLFVLLGVEFLLRLSACLHYGAPGTLGNLLFLYGAAHNIQLAAFHSLGDPADLLKEHHVALVSTALLEVASA